MKIGSIFGLLMENQLKQVHCGGRRGQGKVTYHSLSPFFAKFALTKRFSDGQTLLYGKTRYKKTIKTGKGRFENFLIFGEKTRDKIKPIKDAQKLEKFINACGLAERTDYGTTWLFPYVSLSKFNKKEIFKILVSEYYFAIVDEGLHVDVDGETLNSDTLAEVIDKYQLKEPSSDEIEFIEDCLTLPSASMGIANTNWLGNSKSSKMNTEAFDEPILEKLKENFDSFKTVGIQLPVCVYLKNSDPVESYFRVYVKKLAGDSRLKKVNVVRSSLIISDEKPLAGMPGSYMGLVLAKDDPIATFLSESEDAAHVRFNQRKVSEKYCHAQKTLQSVRYALPQLIRLLGIVDERDESALSSILSIPDMSASRSRGEGETRQPPQEAIQKPFVISQRKNKLFLRKNSKFMENLPSEIRLEVAYETGYGVGNPFKQWSRFDFDLSDESKHTIEGQNVEIIKRNGNQLDLAIEGKDPKISIDGFNPITRLVIRVEEL